MPPWPRRRPTLRGATRGLFRGRRKWTSARHLDAGRLDVGISQSPDPFEVDLDCVVDRLEIQTNDSFDGSAKHEIHDSCEAGDFDKFVGTRIMFEGECRYRRALLDQAIR